jgi:hypothetical protein
LAITDEELSSKIKLLWREITPIQTPELGKKSKVIQYFDLCKASVGDLISLLVIITFQRSRYFGKLWHEYFYVAVWQIFARTRQMLRSNELRIDPQKTLGQCAAKMTKIYKKASDRRRICPS